MSRGGARAGAGEADGMRRASEGLRGMFVVGRRAVVVVVMGDVKDGRFAGRNVACSLWEDTERVKCAGAAFVRE